MALCIFGFTIFTELPTLLISFVYSTVDPVFTNLIIYRTCHAMGYNETECSLLGSDNQTSSTQSLENLIQPHASMIVMTYNMLDLFIGGVVCLFLGSWSDKYGRKPLMIIPLTGYIISHSVIALMCHIPSIPPWYFIVYNVINGCAGSSVLFYTGILSYISDTTTGSDTGFRLGLYTICSYTSNLVANISSSKILYSLGYSGVYLLCTLFVTLALIYVIFCIPESIEKPEKQSYWKEIIKISDLTETCKSILKTRENNKKAIILLSIALISLQNFCSNGSIAIAFLYFREKFHWSFTDFTRYNTFLTVVTLLSVLFGTYILHKLLKLPESIIILTGLISNLNFCVLLGLATTNWHIYFAVLVYGYSGLVVSMVQSLLAKLIEAEEAGRIFSIIVLITQSFFGSVGVPIFTLIYNFTLNIDPGIFCFVSAAIMIICVSIMCVIISLQGLKSQFAYGILEADS